MEAWVPLRLLDRLVRSQRRRLHGGGQPFGVVDLACVDELDIRMTQDVGQEPTLVNGEHRQIAGNIGKWIPSGNLT